MVVKYEAGTLNFTPKCSLELLKEQKKHMGMYLNCLEIRAEIEGIELWWRELTNVEYAIMFVTHLIKTAHYFIIEGIPTVSVGQIPEAIEALF